MRGITYNNCPLANAALRFWLTIPVVKNNKEVVIGHPKLGTQVFNYR